MTQTKKQKSDKTRKFKNQKKMIDLETEIFITLVKNGCLSQSQIACEIIETDEGSVVTRQGYKNLYHKLNEMQARGKIVSKYESDTSTVVYSLS